MDDRETIHFILLFCVHLHTRGVAFACHACKASSTDKRFLWPTIGHGEKYMRLRVNANKTSHLDDRPHYNRYCCGLWFRDEAAFLLPLGETVNWMLFGSFGHGSHMLRNCILIEMSVRL